MRLRRIALGAVCLLGTVIACGGGDGVDCDFSACGGDPTGTWDLQGVCADFTPPIDDLQETCPGATASFDVDASGTITFADNGIYSASLTFASAVALTLPGTCFDGTGITSCEQLDQMFDEAECSGDITRSCICRASQTTTTGDDGPWSVSGTTLTLGNDPDVASFCETGDSLKLEVAPDDPADEPILYVLSRS